MTLAIMLSLTTREPGGFSWGKTRLSDCLAKVQLRIGLLYHNGEGVTQDFVQARFWYEKAVARGQVGAQLNLGYLYQYSEGVRQDYGQARACYEKAAASGNLHGQFRLGYLYHCGLGVVQDYSLARACYKKAAVQGQADAQFLLGHLYQNGLGVPQDDEQARSWYERAAAQGHEAAQNELDRDFVGVADVFTQDGFELIQLVGCEDMTAWDAAVVVEFGVDWSEGEGTVEESGLAGQDVAPAGQQAFHFGAHLAVELIVAQGVPVTAARVALQGIAR